VGLCSLGSTCWCSSVVQLPGFAKNGMESDEDVSVLMLSPQRFRR